MKRNLLFPAIIGVGIILASGFTAIEPTGEANWTGSPIDGGPGTHGQCSNCHSGGSSTPTLSLSASPAFGGSGTALNYTSGTTYTVTVIPVGSYARYGFNCEIMNSQSSTTVANFGTFGTAVTSNCQIYAASGIYPSCASHNQASTTSGWSFKWTAPASGTGFIYADVLGANDDGTDGGDHVSGVFNYTLTASTTGIETHQNNTINLSVFPNPASDKVSIAYTLTEKGSVSVKLYNLNGDLVADLVNETQGVGMQSTSTNLPAGLAKGMYMVKLTLNGQETTQKLLVR